MSGSLAAETVALTSAAPQVHLSNPTLRDLVERKLVSVAEDAAGRPRFVLRQLRAELDALPSCLVAGCDRPGTGREMGGCGQHECTLLATGKTRPPEVGAKISAALLGSRRGPQSRTPDQLAASRQPRWCEDCGGYLGVFLRWRIRQGRARYCRGCTGRRGYRPGLGASERPERLQPRGAFVDCGCCGRRRPATPSEVQRWNGLCRGCFNVSPAGQQQFALRDAGGDARWSAVADERLQAREGESEFAAVGAGHLAEVVSERIGRRRSAARVTRVARDLGLGELFGTVRVYSDDDVATIAETIESNEHALAKLHRDPRWRGRWKVGRHGSTDDYGRAARELAAKDGKSVGRPDLEQSEPELAARVRALAASGSKQRAVVRVVNAEIASGSLVPRTAQRQAKGISRDHVRGVFRADKVGENPPIPVAPVGENPF